MPDLIPVNPTTPIPPTPRTHRDKRRKQSVPLPRENDKDRDQSDGGRKEPNDDEHTIDEYA